MATPQLPNNFRMRKDLRIPRPTELILETQKNLCGARAEDLVSIVFALEAWGPEFKSKSHIKTK